LDGKIDFKLFHFESFLISILFTGVLFGKDSAFSTANTCAYCKDHYVVY
jgi:hypothetical protein